MGKPRILGGAAKGAVLDTPARGTRPSPARLREAVFDALQFRPRGRFLDLYAGSGALGLEAASRGWEATLVELSPAAAAVIRRNAGRARLRATVIQADALAFAARDPGTYDVAAAAPPYPDDLLAIFRALLGAAPVAPGGLYLLQHPTGLDVAGALEPELRRLGPPSPADGGTGTRRDAPHAGVRVRRYGSNAVTWIAVPERPAGTEAGSVPDGVSEVGC